MTLPALIESCFGFKHRKQSKSDNRSRIESLFKFCLCFLLLVKNPVLQMWINSEIISIGLVYFSSCVLFKLKADSGDNPLGRGFGEHISWSCFEKGLVEAKEQKLPMMLIIHKSWCGACKALKPKFATSTEIQDLSKHFVMVNIADDEEPKDSKFAPDGEYIPRILFLHPNGEVMTQYYNDIGNPNYKYYYSDCSSIVRSMKKVLNNVKQDKKLLDEL